MKAPNVLRACIDRYVLKSNIVTLSRIIIFNERNRNLRLVATPDRALERKSGRECVGDAATGLGEDWVAASLTLPWQSGASQRTQPNAAAPSGEGVASAPAGGLKAVNQAGTQPLEQSREWRGARDHRRNASWCFVKRNSNAKTWSSVEFPATWSCAHTNPFYAQKGRPRTDP